MSSPSEKAEARVPRRERGRRRVATLLEAASSLFAEKGYDAVTMTEVAERAGASIGSLYQFFPSKEALADALLDRFRESLQEALDEIEERAARCTVPELAEALLGLLAGFQEGKAARMALVESRREASARVAELKRSLLGQLTRILRLRIPGLSSERAETMARVVLQLMKAAEAQRAERDPAIRDGVTQEFHQLLELYLKETMIDTGRDGLAR